MRNPVRFFLGFVTGVLLAIVLDYAVLNILYLVQRGSFTECFPVQGNTGGYIPQGMALVSPEAEALSPEQDQTPGPHSHPLLLQTAYNHKHLVSRLYW